MSEKTKELKIAISGFSGCGNTSVSNMLAERLSIPCINYTFRNLAQDMGLEFTDIVRKSKSDFSFDRMVDEKQIDLANKGPCVLASRLAIWLLNDACLKVFLLAPIELRSQRISNREGKSLDEVRAFTERRDADDTARYKELYGIDNTDYKFADLIIDTSLYLPEKICDIIIDCLKEKKILP